MDDVNLTRGRAPVPLQGRGDQTARTSGQRLTDHSVAPMACIHKPRRATDVDDLTSHSSCYTGGVKPRTVSDEIVNRVNELSQLKALLVDASSNSNWPYTVFYFRTVRKKVHV